jgi:hypothetical protein
MRRAAFLGCAFILPLILPALSATAVTGQLNFGAENLVASTVQMPFNHSDSYHLQVICHDISRRISPVSQIFYPGSVTASLSGPSLIAHNNP